MVRATAIAPKPIASFRAVDVRGSEGRSAFERGSLAPSDPAPQGGSWSRFDRTKRALLPGRRPNAVVAYGGRARLGFDTASKGRKRSDGRQSFWRRWAKPRLILDIGHEDILQAVKRQRKATRSEPDATVASEATS